MPGKSFIKSLLASSNLKRFLFFFLSDILIIILSLYLSFFIRFEFTFPAQQSDMFMKALPVFIIFKIGAFAGFRMYKITWRYVGLNELYNIVGALVVVESVLMVLILVPLSSHMPMQFLSFHGFPRSIFPIDSILTLIFVSAVRISKRIYLEVVYGKRQKGEGKRTIIVGAGNTGEMLLRDMAKHGYSDFYPVALLDDDKIKIGTYIHGVKIVGAINKLKYVVTKYNAEMIIIAIPSLDYKSLRTIYNSAKKSGVETIKIVPRIYDFHKPDINLKKLEEIRIEDLIGRQTVKISYGKIGDFLKDRVIMVTGAGGSIGSEITLQVCGFRPERVVLFEIDETGLHNLSLKLKGLFPHLFDKIHFVVGDIKDTKRVRRVFNTFKPEIVFHAAAYKHVPMMEYNPKEALKVNIFGAYNLAEASIRNGVQKFVMISTDKAVRPTSIMGATKRMAEYICKAFNDDGSQNIDRIQNTEERGQNGENHRATEFISVRFGNVLGSRGSVLPLFLEQLKHGGPLTITHKDMKRYFMTIPEAVSLVLQASVMGRGGDVLVLDMGEPVKIVELAEELIKIHGLEPYKDIDIDYIGLRPGENLFEEVLTAEEGTVATMHNRVFVAKDSNDYCLDEIEGMLKEFEILLDESPGDSYDEIKKLLKKYVKYFANDSFLNKEERVGKI